MVGLEPVTGDPAQLKEAYGCFPSGVTALCALDGGTPDGMAASAFTCVSLEPGLVSVCLGNSSSTWPRLRRARRLGVSVLAEHQNEACRALSLKTGDRFAGVDWTACPAGAVYIPGAVAWLECSIEEEFPAGDHTIALLAVHALRIDPGGRPLIFHGSRFRQLVAA